jgi:cation:H+ antiporter
MLLSLLYIFTALVLLYFGATWLVKGSTALAIKAGVSPLLTGLTVVAFGTSSPELFVSLNSAISGHGNIAIGNVVGSNIFNILVILGISSWFLPLKIKLQVLKFDIPILILTTFGFMFLFADRLIGRLEGGILVVGIVLYTLINILLAHREKKTDTNSSTEIKPSNAKTQSYWSLALVVFGIGVLVAGSELLVKGAVFIAHAWGVSETIIGLTIISAGTSLPVLASSIVATIKKEYDIAIGNVIGSNIFNILGIIGFSSLIKPLSAIAISNFDLYAMLGATLLLLPFLRASYTLKRDEGIFMIGIYLVYLYYLWPK